MSNFVIQGYANLENVNANNMDLFYATMSAQLSTFFPTLGGTQGSICSGIGNIINKFGQTGTGNVFSFENGYIRFLDQVTNLTTDVSIKPCYAYLSGSAVTITCPISVTQYYVVALMNFNTPTDPFTTSTSVIISPTAMTLAQIAAEPVPELYNPLFAITTTDGVNYTVHVDANCAFNYGYIIGNPFPDITDIAGLVSITGAGGLSVTNMSTFNGASSFLAGFGAIGACTFNEVASRGGIITFAQSATVAYLGSNDTNSGAFNGFQFDDTVSRPILNNPSSVIASVYEVACINDFSVVQSFSVADTGGNAWDLLCQSFTGGFPSSNFTIIGNSNYNFPSGISSANIDLGAAGIASTNCTLAVFALTSETDYNTNLVSLSIFTNATTKLVSIGTTGSPGAGVSAIQFKTIYK